jgi:CRP-like cAMP-binding protein
VTSIVLGFALQNSVGSIISGLLLLFEQPFQLGDWLDAEGGRGRIVEVNWRSVHIETGDGVRIIPNATLAGATFTNLSEPPGQHRVTIPSGFGADDPPDAVLGLLDRVARDVPVTGIEPRVTTAMTGANSYATTIAIRSPADADDVTATFTRWLWYAARRAGLHLDGGQATWSTPEAVGAALAELAPSWHIRDDDVESAAAGMRLERWAAGEVVQHEGAVPDALRFIRRGRVSLLVTLPGHGLVQLDELRPGEVLGITTLTKERVTPAAIAMEEVETLSAPQAAIEDLVRTTPMLARKLGQELDLRRTHYRELIGQTYRRAVATRLDTPNGDTAAVAKSN